MSYDTWYLLFLGTVIAMLMLNLIQWWLYRERVYALYTFYMLAWIAFFCLLNAADTWPVIRFVQVAIPMAAYIAYFELTIYFLNLQITRPGLIRIFRTTQVVLITYIVLEILLCFLTDWWQQPFHGILHTVVRSGLAGLSFYIISIIYRWENIVARLFITGSTALVIGAIAAMLATLFFSQPWGDMAWHKPLAYMQTGILAELLFFSTGLTYRHRSQEIRQAVRKALVEKELIQEREQRQREQLEAALNVQQLKQEKTEVQIRALQTQINPHFLFNSLNTLSSLIDEDPLLATTFVDELSTVYRYLLRSNVLELTTLQLELNFIQSYLNLLKTRYGRGLITEIQVRPDHAGLLLPPLTLQLLTENAVKHNVILANKPLVIRIKTDDDRQIIVENSLQRKTLRVESNGIGLSNITSKYKLLGSRPPVFEEDIHSFRVILPVIETLKEFSATKEAW
ncbi:sensor histidine kinase [Arsenicibacter rosenii]|uniref:Sensor protein lytS n=1 Tax=Arsenicibacter rosenii TaxID=1750698 RepID=A0A1S2VHU2_9BACT|nr:histidine kinase [Arsenicibacter rosenii]OIN57980.1 hypothetical protein BLX24_18010 [Arsenicibacter rosenii]